MEATREEIRNEDIKERASKETRKYEAENERKKTKNEASIYMHKYKPIKIEYRDWTYLSISLRSQVIEGMSVIGMEVRT